MLDRTTETICMVRNREAFFEIERTTAYSDRKRSISVLHSAISCVIDLYASVKPRRPCIFINLRDVSWRRLNELCYWISKIIRTCKHTVLRPFSARPPRHPEAGVRAIKTLTVDEAARSGHRERPCCAWLSVTRSEETPFIQDRWPTSII